MIDNAFRALLPARVGPVVAIYERLGLSPNHVTFIGFALACAAAVAVAAEQWWLGRLADGTDGVYARASGRATRFGAYLDIVLDMAAYSAMVLGFAVAHPELLWAWLVMLFLYVLCITSALALGAEEADAGTPPRDERGLRLGAGLAEGGETGLAYTAMLLCPPGWLGPIAVAWIVVLVTTVVARSVLAARTLRG
jgi:phosphatidylglycerophosphate synthase